MTGHDDVGASSHVTRASLGLVAGAVAVALNVMALAGADLIGLPTAHGGLLRLVTLVSGLPVPTGPRAEVAFHVVVGLAMALAYALVLRRLPGPPWARGLLCAAAVWLANAAIVLPAIGEGFAGGRDLTLAGIAWFAAAHTLFFVVLAVLFDWLARRRLETTERLRRPAGTGALLG